MSGGIWMIGLSVCHGGGKIILDCLCDQGGKEMSDDNIHLGS